MAKTNVVTRKKYDLTPEVIEELKKALQVNGYSEKIYKFDNDGDTIVFRPLFAPDYQDIQAWVKTKGDTTSQDEIDWMVCQKAIVWPGELTNPVMWDVQKAGIQSSLAKNILARSGFIVPDIDQSSYMSVTPLVVVPHGPKPSAAAVGELKEKYNWSLQLVDCEGEYYVIRPINRAEWRALTTSETADLDLLTAEKVTVWSKDYPGPVDFSVRAGGVARTVAEESMRISGFSQQVTVEEL